MARTTLQKFSKKPIVLRKIVNAHKLKRFLSNLDTLLPDKTPEDRNKIGMQEAVAEG